MEINLSETSIKGKIDEVFELTKNIEYIINYGDLLSDDFLLEIDDKVLDKYLLMDVYTDALIKIILTKNSKIYYEKKNEVWWNLQGLLLVLVAN